ncbi:hypothetical protein SK128_000601, partial [Halocaridina rubra]
MATQHYLTCKLWQKAVVLVSLFSAMPGNALSKAVYRNDIDPEIKLPSPKLPFLLALDSNMNSSTDLQELMMKYKQDERICSWMTLEDIISSVSEIDREATLALWSEKCYQHAPPPFLLEGNSSVTAEGLTRKRRKTARSSHLSRSDLTQAKAKKLNRNKHIICTPKKTVVELPNEDRNVRLKPPGVYIKQCSGCCDSKLLACRPKKTKIRKFKVMVFEYSAGNLVFAEDNILKTFAVEEHKECQCECKIRREDCSLQQLYDEGACRCICPPNALKSCSSGK